MAGAAIWSPFQPISIRNRTVSPRKPAFTSASQKPPSSASCWAQAAASKSATPSIEQQSDVRAPRSARTAGDEDNFARTYERMFTARAATRSSVIAASVDSAAINALAGRVSGIASVGLNAVAFVSDT